MFLSQSGSPCRVCFAPLKHLSARDMPHRGSTELIAEGREQNESIRSVFGIRELIEHLLEGWTVVMDVAPDAR